MSMTDTPEAMLATAISIRLATSPGPTIWAPNSLRDFRSMMNLMMISLADFRKWALSGDGLSTVI
jgi:hypothetical protein